MVSIVTHELEIQGRKFNLFFVRAKVFIAALLHRPLLRHLIIELLLTRSWHSATGLRFPNIYWFVHRPKILETVTNQHRTGYFSMRTVRGDILVERNSIFQCVLSGKICSWDFDNIHFMPFNFKRSQESALC